MRQQLQAKLDEAQDTLENTRLQHEFELSTNNLQQFIADLEDSIDDSLMSVDESFEHFAQVLQELLGLSENADVNGAYQKVLNLLMGSGYTFNDYDDIMSGSNQPTIGTATGSSTTGTAATSGYVEISPNEFLSSLSTTLTNTIVPKFDLTNGYLSNIQTLLQSKIAPDVSKIASTNNNVNLSFQAPTIEVNGAVDATVVSDLQKLLDQSSDYTMQKMFAELRKMGYQVTYGG